MAKVENENGTFYIPDEEFKDKTKTVDELEEKAIPYDVHTQQKIIEDFQEDLEQVKLPTNEDLIEIGKEHSLEWQEYLEKKQLLRDAKNELNNLLQHYGTNS